MNMKKGYIYKLTSPSNKCYIGQTVNLKSRLTSYKNFHKKEKQPYIFNALKKYGFDNFTVDIIETIEKETTEELQDSLNTLEIFYIDKFDTTNKEKGYNICKGGNQGRLGVKTSEETKEKLRNAWTPELREHVSKQFRGKRSGNALNIIAVLQYNMDGNFIAEYESLTDAAKAVNGAQQSISKCCKCESKYSYGYLWKFKESDNYPLQIEPIKLIKKESRQRTVYQFSLDGIFIQEFKNLTEASDFTGISKGALSNCCTEKSKSSGGYIWKYQK